MRYISDIIEEAKHSFRIFDESKHSFRIKSHLKKTTITHHPESKEELINCINEELKTGNTDLNCIDTSQIENMNWLFGDVKEEYWALFKNIDISNWDVSNVKSFECTFLLKSTGPKMFKKNEFNCDLSKWDVSSCENFGAMFLDCINFTGEGLENWTINKNCIRFSQMFNGCKNLKCNLECWNIPKRINNVKVSKNQTFDGVDKNIIPSWYWI